MADETAQPSSAAEVGRASRGFLVFVGHLIIVFMAFGSLSAENRLAAFGLTCYTASGLLAAPRLLANAAVTDPLERWLNSGPVLALGRFHDRHRNVIGLIGYTQSALVLAGGFLLTHSHYVLGAILLAVGIVVMTYVYLSNAIFWATWRSRALPDGRRVDLVDRHMDSLTRRLGPDAVWVLAGGFFFAGTLLQFLDALGV